MSGRLEVFRVPTSVGFFSRHKSPTKVGTLTPVTKTAVQPYLIG
jgi:hypothetical protein